MPNQNRPIFGLPTSELAAVSARIDRTIYTYHFVPYSSLDANKVPILTTTQIATKSLVVPGHSSDSAPAPTGQDRSELGFLFLDRIRLRQNGYAVADHVYTLGLSPGEEVVIEERVIRASESKHESVREGETTREREDLATDLSEFAETLNATLNKTRTEGFKAGGELGFEYGVTVEIEAGIEDNLQTSDDNSRQTVTRRVQNASLKSTTKTRELTKFSIQVSTSERFESGSKRVIKNPNTFTPISVFMFRMCANVNVTYERFGVRLSWCPHLKDPAFDYRQSEWTEFERILAEELTSIALPPAIPLPADFNKIEQIIVGINGPNNSPEFQLDKWGLMGDMRYDYDLPINIPTGKLWDRDPAFVQSSFTVHHTGDPDRSFNIHLVGNPWVIVNSKGEETVWQKIHAGVDHGVGRPPVNFSVSLSARAYSDPAYLAAQMSEAQSKYLADKAGYDAAVNKLRSDAKKAAQVRFDKWKSKRRERLDVKYEVVSRFIAKMFPINARDEFSEISLWKSIFDWDLMSVYLYGNEWAGSTLPEPDYDPRHFLNASWAQMILPIRPGYEEKALTWIFDQKQDVAACRPEVKDLIGSTIYDLNDWRIRNLGSVHEVQIGRASPHRITRKAITLSTWVETVPINGLHYEVTQAPSTATDDYSDAINQGRMTKMDVDIDISKTEVGLREVLTKNASSSANVTVNFEVAAPKNERI